MVGSTPEQLESSICESIAQPQRDPLKEDISQYLLLHHDYAAKPETEPKRIKRSPSRKKLKEIRPKTKNIHPAVQTTPNNQEILYGTYDEATNCITILVNDEPVTEAVTTISEASSIKDPASPSIQSDSSDCGYESYDSPHSVAEPDTEMWDERITELSELFPSLI